MMIRQSYFLLLLTGLLLLGFLSGCDDDPAATCPGPEVGRIEGHVGLGRSMIHGYVQATAEIGNQTYLSPIDFYHTYQLELPLGRYTLELFPDGAGGFSYPYSSQGLGYVDALPDTLTLETANNIQTIDWALGGLDITLQVPDFLNDEGVRVILHRQAADPSEPEREYLSQEALYAEDGLADFSIRGVLPGDYKVELVLGFRQYLCSCPYDGEHLWWPDLHDPADSPVFTILADSLLTLEQEFLDSGTRIEGRIGGAWLEMGMAEPTLTLVDPDSNVILGMRQVAVDGSFALDLVQPSAVKLLVTHQGIEQWFGGPGFDEADVFELTAGQHLTDLELVSSGLRLDVIGSGNGFHGSQIHFYEPASMAWLGTWQTGSLSTGTYAVPNLWPGNFLAYITPDSYDLGRATWLAQWFDRAPESSSAEIITITSAGQIVQKDVVLEDGGAISGTLNFGEDPSTYQHIFVTPVDDPEIWGSYYAFEGRPNFQIQGLPDGVYKVGAFPVYQGWERGLPAPEGTVWYPGTTSWEDGQTVEISGAGSVEGIVILMP